MCRQVAGPRKQSQYPWGLIIQWSAVLKGDSSCFARMKAPLESLLGSHFPRAMNEPVPRPFWHGVRSGSQEEVDTVDSITSPLVRLSD